MNEFKCLFIDDHYRRLGENITNALEVTAQYETEPLRSYNLIENSFQFTKIVSIPQFFRNSTTNTK